MFVVFNINWAFCYCLAHRKMKNYSSKVKLDSFCVDESWVLNIWTRWLDYKLVRFVCVFLGLIFICFVEYKKVNKELINENLAFNNGRELVILVIKTAFILFYFFFLLKNSFSFSFYLIEKYRITTRCGFLRFTI